MRAPVQGRQQCGARSFSSAHRRRVSSKLAQWRAARRFKSPNDALLSTGSHEAAVVSKPPRVRDVIEAAQGFPRPRETITHSDVRTGNDNSINQRRPISLLGLCVEKKNGKGGGHGQVEGGNGGEVQGVGRRRKRLNLWRLKLSPVPPLRGLALLDCWEPLQGKLHESDVIRFRHGDGRVHFKDPNRCQGKGQGVLAD